MLPRADIAADTLVAAARCHAMPSADTRLTTLMPPRPPLRAVAAYYAYMPRAR